MKKKKIIYIYIYVCIKKSTHNSPTYERAFHIPHAHESTRLFLRFICAACRGQFIYRAGVWTVQT